MVPELKSGVGEGGNERTFWGGELLLNLSKDTYQSPIYQPWALKEQVITDTF
jgi:hypothetical protein